MKIGTIIIMLGIVTLIGWGIKKIFEMFAVFDIFVFLFLFIALGLCINYLVVVFTGEKQHG